MDRATLRLSLSTEAVEAFYAGRARYVQATADDGREIRFPAALLRPFVTEHGVQGTFEIEFDEAGRLRAFERKGPAPRWRQSKAGR